MLQVCAVDYTAYYLLLPLFRAARDRGWDVTFVCADGEYAAALRAEGFAHWPMPMSRGWSPLRHTRAVLTLASRLRRSMPDVIHTHTPIGGAVGRGAAIVAGHRAVTHTLHGLPFDAHAKTIGDRIFMAVERILGPRTQLVLSQSRSDAETAVRLGLARRADVFVIGNGVDTTRFSPDQHARERVRSGLGIPPAAIVVTCVARLVREKGLLDLADAAYQLRAERDLTFLLVGRSEPSDRTHLEDVLATHPAATALGERWRLLGARNDVDLLLKASDLFVLPSWREGLPRSIIEAMSTGLPVVATDLGGCRELITAGVTGTLVAPRDPAALASAILSIVRSSSRQAMGEAARGIAIREFDEAAVLRRQLDLIESRFGSARRVE
jgi:glycosyltransferase involved in cell wall biosynthesis